ncbi:hypothetical protein RRG08_002884 [Elysia crispata]|uniref:Uncharacterized protein n=1 Tax=Elysia crispata TaxID=231223 RepID=A0AAE1AD72_9GAST|nr:hypothetical protein RRG08_002884 [Elysia crispata]
MRFWVYLDLKTKRCQPNGETLMSLVQRKFDMQTRGSQGHAHDLFLHEWCDSALACTYRHHNQTTVLQEAVQDKRWPSIRKETTFPAGVNIVSPRQCASPYGLGMTDDLAGSTMWELLEHPRYSPDLLPRIFTYSLK